MTSQTTPAPPTTKQIRESVAIIHTGIHDPDADPIPIAAAHTLLARARDTTTPPVHDWLNAYLDRDTTTNGHRAFRDAVNTLALHFKLPPVTRLPTPGEQGTLFD